MEPVIHLRSTVSLLGRFPALAGVDLTVDPGEIVLLRGANGAGKSTLLKVCSGLLPVAAGEARVLGIDLTDDRFSIRSRVGLLGHATFLYDELTVADNVAFWARAARADIDDAHHAMDRMGLGGRLRDVAVARLSAGQRRRVAIAVLLARRPELWLLDEPHAGLDADGRDLLDGLIIEAAAAGATVLFASHELDRAHSVAERVVTLSGGIVASDEGTSTPADVVIDPIVGEADRVP
jgi:heme ABC exporter ATP-binding subunit CcmA